MTRQRRIPVVFAVLLAAVALLAFGCGGDDPSPAASTGESDQPAADESEHAEEAEHADEADHADGEVHADEADHDHGDEADHADGEVHADEADHADGEVHADDADHGDEGVQTVAVSMTDASYVIDAVEFSAGTSVTFDFTNDDEVEHQAIFASMHEHGEFAADGYHGGQNHHGEIDAITLGPGESGSLTVTFDVPGEVILGCHTLDHWHAGMLTSLAVV